MFMSKPFPNHNSGQDKGQTMMVPTSEEDTPIQPKSKPDLDEMAQQVQNLLKFKHFYNQKDFNPKQRMAINKSIIELTDPSGNCGLVESRSRRSNKFEDGTVVFYDNERCDLPSSHTRPLYVNANVKGIEL